VSMSMRSKFVVFGAVPVTVLAVAGAAAFTFGQDISQINGTQEQSDYLVVATNATSDTNNWHQKAYIGGAPGLTGSLQDVTVATKYGELPQWFQVDSGASGVPSAVQEPGDLAFINGASSTTTPDDTNNGNQGGGTSNLNVVQAIHVKGNITNVAALRQTYGTCLIPIRLWKTTNDGGAFTDVTQTYLDTQNRLTDGTNGQTPSTANPSGSGTDPFYVDCTTGEFEFTVPTDVAADHKTDETLAYELSVERGGVFGTFNNNTGAQPEFVFQATPIAYDPTNQFNTPGANGNGQYTPNLKSDARAVAPAGTALPNWQALGFFDIGAVSPTWSQSWSTDTPVLQLQHFYYGCAANPTAACPDEYVWRALANVNPLQSGATVNPDGSWTYYDYCTFYYSPDGVNYTAFP